MKAIIPIGGGEISSTTLNIDKYILSLANKDKPKVLFIPVASGDNINYINKFKEYYESLNATVDVLALSYMNNDNLIRSKIFSSDIIYIGGGNTSRMMRIFKRCNVNNYLIEAYNSNIILTGLSAGAMGFFKSGYSDANRSTDINAPLTLVKCLGLIDYCFCPHYNELERKSFEMFLNEKQLNGIALDDNTALVYIDDEIKGIIKSDNNAKGYIIINNNKKEIKEI